MEKQTNLILLDFNKAFDKVNHLKLLYKLSCFVVKGTILNWIQSFLIGRIQTVVLDRESSKEVTVTSGVPQGSVLGLLLFLLYINDLPDNIQSQVRLFADGTAVYLTVSNMKDNQVLQSDLSLFSIGRELVIWSLTWANVRYSILPAQKVQLSPDTSCITRNWNLWMQRSSWA